MMIVNTVIIINIYKTDATTVHQWENAQTRFQHIISICIHTPALLLLFTYFRNVTITLIHIFLTDVVQTNAATFFYRYSNFSKAIDNFQNKSPFCHIYRCHVSSLASVAEIIYLSQDQTLL